MARNVTAELCILPNYFKGTEFGSSVVGSDRKMGSSLYDFTLKICRL